MSIDCQLKCMSRRMRICISSVITAALIVTLSCKNEDTPRVTVPIVSLKGTDCLQNSPDIMENYVNGKASEYEVNAFWTCFRGAISTFMNRVEGSDPKRGYKATELRRFLETNFLGGDKPDAIKINDELLSQFMHVKQLLIGGHELYLTQRELNRLIELFEELRGMSQELRPYIKVLFQTKKDQKPDPDVVGLAAVKFEDILIRVGSLIAKQKVTYKLSDFKSFLNELNSVFERRGNGDGLKKAAEFVPLISAAKAVLFPGDSGVIGPDEWDGLFRFGGHAFSTSMRFGLFLGEDSMKTAAMLNETQRMGRSVFMILNEAFARRPDHIIPSSAFDNLFEEYAKKYKLPLNISLAQMQNLWSTLVDKILPEYGTNVPGWSLAEMKRLETEFENFISVQFYLIGNERVGQGVEAIEEMKGVLDTYVLPMDSMRRIIFLRNPAAVWDIYSKTKYNALRVAIRLVMQAYTADPIRRHNLGGVNEKEFDAAYTAIKPFLVLLDVVKENDTELGPRIFREANLFTTRANGDTQINFYEVIEYAHFVHSGINTGKLLRADLVGDPADPSTALCPHTDDAIDVHCFRQHYRDLFSRDYANMPKMVEYFATLNAKDWKTALTGLETTNRTGGATQTPIENNDIYEMGVLLQYIEVLMIRFDVDQNGYLDLQEGLTALPLFQVVIAGIMGVDPVADAKEVRALFTYMLRYGEAPNPAKPLTILRYLNWKWSEKSWKLTADRSIILKILSSLSAH